MAFAKQYYSSYKSNNGLDYYLEIWVDGFSGNASEITLGAGGPVISYDTEQEDRFSPIISSQCVLPFMVKGVGTQSFIQLLRTTYQERQVYLHLYRATSSTYSTVKPLWSGYLIMDLGSGEDVSFPYEQNLTFVDGLSVLKEIDFVQFPEGSPPSTPSDPNPIPFEDRTLGNYAPENMYWGPARYTYWIKEILLKSGAATTSQGASLDYGFTTAVNWYNGVMTSTSQSSDPLYLTESQASMFHTKDENNFFKPENCYEVLKELMRHWGCRITYWKHEFWIVQIPEYIEDESGFIDNPDNINSRQYNKSGTYLGSQDHLGDTYYTRYEQTIQSNQISKLVGTKYNYLPAIHRADATFLSLNSENHYGGFPFGSNATTKDIFQGRILNPSNADFLWVSVPLNWEWDMTGADTTLQGGHTKGWWCSIKFNLYAFQKVGNTTTTYYLQYDSSSGNYYWIEEANWVPLGNTSPKYIIKSHSLTETDYIGFQEQIPFEDSSGNAISMTGQWDFYMSLEDYGTSSSTPGSFYCRFSGYQPSNFYSYIKRNPNDTTPYLPTTGNVSGSGPQSISGKVSWTNSLQDNTLAQATPNIQQYPSSYNTGSSYNMDIKYNFVSPLKGFLQVLTTSQNSTYGFTNNTQITNSTNTESFSFGDLVWGDTVQSTARGMLGVYNGSDFVKTNPTGQWGRGTLTGTQTFTQILIDEFLTGQIKVLISPNMRLVVGEQNKDQTATASGGGTATRPRFVNPIGRLREFRTNAYDPEYIFRRGSFYSLFDEWDYEGYEILRDTITVTTVTNDIGGLGGAQDDAPIASAKLQGPVTSALMMNSPVAYVRQTVAATGSNVAVNGNFNVATGWTLGTGWSIDTTAKKANFTATGSTSDLTQSVLTQEKTFQINFTVVVTAGTLLVKAGSSGTTETITASGDYSIYLDCEGSSVIKFQAGTTFTGSITHVHIAEQKSLSSLPINSLGTTVFKTNDTFNLINSKGGEILPLTVSSNQGASDDTISVTSTALYDDIGIDSVLLINQDDLSAQYQNKTKGTVGGFDITATSIDSGSVAISSYIDDDTFGTASATSLATSESIKAYVDTQVGSADTLQEVTDNGATTTNAITFAGGTTTNVLQFTGGYVLDSVHSLRLDSGTGQPLLFSIADSEKMRLTSDGRLGIGVSNPLTKIHINDGTNINLKIGESSGEIQIKTTNDADTAFTPLIIRANKYSILNGNVLIGTTTDNGDKLQIGVANSAPSFATDPNVATTIASTTNGDEVALQLYVNDGTNNIRSKYFVDDTELLAGFDVTYSTGLNGFAFKMIGSEKMRLSSGGNLLIGTTSDYGAKLNVDGQGRITGTAFLEGEVKIGTTSGANLNFLRTSANYIGATNATGYLVFRTGGYDTALTLDASQNATFTGSLTGTTATFSGNVGVVGTGNLTIRNTSGSGSGIIFLDTTWQGGIEHSAGNLFFRTGGQTDKMVLRHNGNLLIGTTTDSGQKFQVNGASDNEIARFISTDDTAQISIVDDDTTSYFGSKNGLSFISQTGGTPLNGIAVNSSGNVGINQINPTEKLHVVGDALITGDSHADAFKPAVSGNPIKFKNFDSSTEFARITDGGNVGIGTSSPVSKLHVYQDSTSTNSAAGITVENDGTGDAVVQYLLTGSRRWVTGVDNNDNDAFKICSTLDLSSDAVLTLSTDGNATFSGQVTIPATPVASTDAASKGYVDAQIGANNDLQEITDNGATTTNDMTISNGAPAMILKDSTSGSSTVIARNSFRNNVNTEIGTIGFLGDGNLRLTNILSNNITFYTSNAEKMRLTSGGNLLIGTTTDSGAKLNVQGSLQVGVDDTGYDVTFYGDTSGRNMLWDTSYNGLILSDNTKLQLGSSTGSGDLQLLHNGTDSYIQNQIGQLYINQNVNDGDIVLQCDDGSGGITPYITLDGSQATVNVYKTLLIGTTTNTGAYKIDVAGKQRVQDTLELDDVLMLNAISTPSDPAAGKSVIYMDSSDGGIKCKINVGGTVVTRTIASFE